MPSSFINPEDLRPAQGESHKEWEGPDDIHLVMAWYFDVTSENFGNGTSHMGAVKIKGSMNGDLTISIE